MNTRRRFPNPLDYLTNLQAPPPWPAKIRVIARNYWRRVVRRQLCCGHEGEPGC
jgi:hypothetical protein